MPFRFHRSFGPRWLHLVTSKTGLSVSAGRPGMHVNYDLSHRRKKPWRWPAGPCGLCWLDNYATQPSPRLGSLAGPP
jgi:hypothetical protein